MKTPPAKATAHYRAAYGKQRSQRDADVRHAASTILHLVYGQGKDALREALTLAHRSELKCCGPCGEWTRHEGGICQQCHGLMNGFMGQALLKRPD